LISLSTIVSGTDSHWEKMIIEKILQSVSNQKDIGIYTQDENILKIVKTINNIHVVKSCEKADFVLSKLDNRSSCHKPVLLFSYNEYIHTPDAIGVFFWQKGRPTIRFSSQRLKNFGLHIDGELSKFVTTKAY
jgi:hypothetical protein